MEAQRQVETSVTNPGGLDMPKANHSAHVTEVKKLLFRRMLIGVNVAGRVGMLLQLTFFLKYFALLSSVWRTSSGRYKKPCSSNSQASLYLGLRFLTSMGNHISKTNTAGTSSKMNFVNLSTSRKLVAAALHDADVISRQDGVVILSSRGEDSSVADQMVISLELSNGGNGDPVLLPSIVNVSICGPEPSPSTSTNAGDVEISLEQSYRGSYKNMGLAVSISQNELFIIRLIYTLPKMEFFLLALTILAFVPMIKKAISHLNNIRSEKVCEFFRPNTKEWDEDRVRQTFTSIDVVEIMGTRIPQGQFNDRLAWVSSNDGLYIVKNGYKFWQTRHMSVSNVLQSNGWKRLWRLNLPLKVKSYRWMQKCEDSCIYGGYVLKKRSPCGKGVGSAKKRNENILLNYE
ncbi:hypothetical protein POM88_025882 [Heracleum sosnowskyi]|uniref:Uncharacterized protein n=1 Tax=Heracleum sosnowskyi TaxID=360622 RepID=A0AAD8I758_9APIA|nr:hypothetical protein POM88_025882 [Heracleum sosnowskyi]